jgi:hypothetical protein
MGIGVLVRDIRIEVCSDPTELFCGDVVHLFSPLNDVVTLAHFRVQVSGTLVPVSTDFGFGILNAYDFNMLRDLGSETAVIVTSAAVYEYRSRFVSNIVLLKN